MSELNNIAETEYLLRVKQFEEKLGQFPRLKYAILNHRNIRSEEMTFHDKPYLVGIYKDNAQRGVLQSSVQTGKAEFLMVSAFMYAEQGLQVLYVLPTERIRNEFVANRVDTIIEKIPHYSGQVKSSKSSADSRGLKHFGKGAIFYAGSNSGTTFIEKPIDAILADELDKFDLANYEMADDRLTASPYKFKWEAGNPTVEKYGINKSYLESDQREFLYKCQKCNKWQSLDWFKNVVMQAQNSNYILRDKNWSHLDERDIKVFCSHCSSELNRFSEKSQWVAKVTGIKKHGYHIHQLLSPYVEVRTMWEKFKKGFEDDVTMQVFFNSMLGLPFAGKGSKLTDEELNACKQEYIMPPSADPCVMGIDVGKKLHVIVRQILKGEKLRLVWAGTLRSFEEIDMLFSRFEIVGYVIDSMPETREAIKWANKQPGRGWISRYQDKITEVDLNNNDRIVTSDRTMALDRVHRAFLNKQLELPMNAHTIDGGQYYEHMKNPTRIFDEDKKKFVWLGEPDHYYHAEAYCMLAYVARGEFRVVGIPLGVPSMAPASMTGEAYIAEMKDEYFPQGMPASIMEHYRQVYKKPDEE